MTDEEMIHCTDPSRQLERVVAIMRRLRQPGGCPWDAEQTHESIVPNMIEESYELIDAIRSRDWEHMREELGDVLLQVVFHAEIADEHAGFDLNDVAAALCEKLVRRHPHVFQTGETIDADAVLTQWDNIKRRECSIEDKPYLQNTGKGLPALLRACKLQKKAAKVGFDWPDLEGAADKIREELRECEETFAEADADAHVEEELGDLLFSVVNLCRKRHVDPELALARANAKFQQRFSAMESALKTRGIPLNEADLNTMEAAWQEAKNNA